MTAAARRRAAALATGVLLAACASAERAPRVSPPADVAVPPASPSPPAGPTRLFPSGPSGGGDPVLPEAGGLTVEPLAAPGAAAFALDGAPADLWRGVGAAEAGERIAGLPAPLVDPTMRALAVRALAAGVETPDAATAGRLLASRAEKLLDLGAAAEARALATAAPAGGDDRLSAVAARAALASGDLAGACALPEPAVSADVFRQRRAVLCRLAAGDRAGAGLAAELLRDAGDDAFADLAQGVDREETPPGSFEGLTLRALTGAGLDPATAAALPAGLAAAAARQAAFAPASRLAAAETAALGGVLDAAGLRRLYADLGAPPESGAGEDGATERARAFRAILAEPSPERRAALLRAAWTATPDPRLFALAHAPAIEALGPAAGGIAGAALPALLLAGRVEAATAVARLPAAAVDPAAARFRPALEALGLLRPGDGGAFPPDPRLEALRAGLADPAPGPPIRRGAVLLRGLGLLGARPWTTPPSALAEGLRDLRHAGFAAEARAAAAATVAVLTAPAVAGEAG